jgi:hypothetical protein
LAVTLNWAGPGSVLGLIENTAGATPAIVVSEPSPKVSVLKIDLGAGKVFAAGSTTTAPGLSYENAGSPATSQFATIDVSSGGDISELAATLSGDGLTLGPMGDATGGWCSVTASAATLDVTGVSAVPAGGAGAGRDGGALG